MEHPEWFDKLQQYRTADTRKSFFQAGIALGSYVTLVAGMITLQVHDCPYWIIVALSFITGPFFILTFIIMHDCSHCSFFNKARYCSILGHICGIITLTAFTDWRHSHAIHHASVSNLEKRGTGDVWTMTVGEYSSASWIKRLRYRIFRNPLFLFLIAPSFLFLVLNRFPSKGYKRSDVINVVINDSVIAIIVIIAHYSIGIGNFLAVQIPVLFVASGLGVWLFYIQHQFKSVYWSHNGNWDQVRSALEGSSFYKLPGLLRWLSGSIGYHHIHHLNPSIPNYNLKKCYEAIPELQEIIPITIYASFKCMLLALWDEASGQLISFKEAFKFRSH